jgi:hypothetical protein
VTVSLLKQLSPNSNIGWSIAFQILTFSADLIPFTTGTRSYGKLSSTLLLLITLPPAPSLKRILQNWIHFLLDLDKYHFNYLHNLKRPVNIKNLHLSLCFSGRPRLRATNTTTTTLNTRRDWAIMFIRCCYNWSQPVK